MLPELSIIDPSAVLPVSVGPGCTRRDLIAPEGVRVWIVDMAPGVRWPQVDVHGTGEVVFVLEGEVIEGEQRLSSGSYLVFGPHSQHRPCSETGARLFGFNLQPSKAL